jgi:hypothetical protein
MTSDPRPSLPKPRPDTQPDSPPAAAARDRIVVAVDGSEASVRALVWALRKAAGSGLRVEALTTWPLHGAVFVREVAGHFCEPRWRAREVQAEAVSRALAAVDDAPPYELRVVNADLVAALSRASLRAALVVAGSDRPTWSARTRTGPARLTDRLREEVPGPLVVIGPDWTDEDAPARDTAPASGGQRRRSR